MSITEPQWAIAPLAEPIKSAQDIWSEAKGLTYGVYYRNVTLAYCCQQQSEINKEVARQICKQMQMVFKYAPDVNGVVGKRKREVENTDYHHYVLGFAFANQQRADEVKALIEGDRR